MQISAVGVAWYRREDYDRLLTVFSDADKLAGTYDDWLAQATAFEERESKRGVRFIRVVIDPDEFPAWCKSQGLDVNAKARMRFASERAAHIIRGRVN
jgi:hypothetical protein